MSNTTKLGEINLAGTKEGKIFVSNVSEPYGKDTADIVSIGVSLNQEDIQWKAHIPYDNLDELIKILQEVSKNKKGE